MRSSELDVLMFIPSLEGGGAERVMVELASAFVGRGATVELAVAGGGAGAYDAEVPDAVRVVAFGRPRVLAAVPDLVRHLRRRRPRALLSTLEHANVAAVWASRWAPGVRCVVREANTVSADLGDGLSARALLFAMRGAYRRAAAVVAVSGGVGRSVREALGVPAERVHVIPNPSVTPRVWAGAREPVDHPWFAGGQPPVVLAVGRLAPQKDYPTLLRAFAALRGRRPVRLVVLGEGPERDALERLAGELGVADDVSFHGFVANPFAFMARADAFVLSSAWEGLPNALIQARALGVSVVATDCPSGPREILDGGELGDLVAVGDAEAMATALDAALERGPQPAPPAWVARYDPIGVAERYLAVLGVDR